MPVTAVVGGQWGDEGKGKVIYLLSRDADLVVRGHGGANAGHTVVSDQGRFAVHLVPAGIFNPRFGKILPSSMESAGLVEMGNHGSTRVVRGGEPYSCLWIQTWQRTNDAIIAKGVLTESEVVGMRRVFMDPTFTYRTMLLQSVWGRKPPLT